MVGLILSGYCFMAALLVSCITVTESSTSLNSSTAFFLILGQLIRSLPYLLQIQFLVTLEDMPWTPENGFLTPTMKLKRVELKRKYLAEIQSMYESLKSDESVDKMRLSRL